MTPPTTLETRAPTSRRRIVFWLLLLVVLAGLTAWAAFAGYRGYRLASFEPACRQALEAEQWEQLRRRASQWAAWQPENADPWIYWAEAAQRLGDFERAAELLGNLPDDHPRTVPALLERSGLLFGALNRPGEGAETCRRVRQLDPTECEAWKREIYYYAMTLQRREMVETIHAAMDAGCELPAHYIYLIGTDWLNFSDGYEVNGRWLTADPENETLLVARAIHFVGAAGLAEKVTEGEALSATRLVDQAGQVEQLSGEPQGREPAGDFQQPEADRVMRDYLRRFPGNLELLAYFLEEAVSEQDVERVAELLAEAPAESAKDNRFWRYKGWVHARQRELDEAEQAYNEALRWNPYDWVSRHQLADVLRRGQRYEEVEQLERLSAEGKDLRRTLMELRDINAIPHPLLERMANYCEACGQQQVARHLRRRIDGLRLAE